MEVTGMIECQAYMYKENDSPVRCKINFLFIAVYYLLLKFDPQNGLVSIKQGIAWRQASKSFYFVKIVMYIYLKEFGKG